MNAPVAVPFRALGDNHVARHEYCHPSAASEVVRPATLGSCPYVVPARRVTSLGCAIDGRKVHFVLLHHEYVNLETTQMAKNVARSANVGCEYF